MNQLENNLDSDNKPVLPGMLNVLTILTLVASGFGILSAIYSYFTACKTVEKMSEMEMPEVGGFLGKFMSDSLDLLVKQCDHRLVILFSTLVTLFLCVAGALMMRQLKKTGFTIYLIGEILGPISLMIIISNYGLLSWMGLFFPLLFILLYASQRKHLINP